MLRLDLIFQGLVASLAGPTLLDLEMITQSSTEQIAYAMMGRSVGMLLGSFLFGICYHRFNVWLTFTVCFLLVTLSTAILPWTGHVLLLGAVFLVQGGALCLFDAGNVFQKYFISSVLY